MFAFVVCSASLLLGPQVTGVQVLRDVPYCTVAGEELCLDLALPPKSFRGPRPCVVCLHGGAWQRGSRKDLSMPPPLELELGTGKRSLIEWLAQRGYVAASVSYRLAPKHKYPAQIQDAKTAVRFLRSNAEKYRLNPESLAAMGFSAGGHIAALLGTTANDRTLDGTEYLDKSSAVSCVVDFFGPTDLTLYAAAEGIEKAFMVPLLGSRYEAEPKVYQDASPLYRILKPPPFLILHGTADLIVPIIHSERFHDKIVRAGGKSELVTVSLKGHGWTGQPAIDSMAKVATFLADQLKVKTP